MKLEWKIGGVDLAIKNGDERFFEGHPVEQLENRVARVTVAGWRSEIFGIDQRDESLRLTHLRTGMRVPAFYPRTLASAMRLAEALADVLDWDVGDFGEYAAIRKALEPHLDVLTLLRDEEADLA